jgi:transcriptional regulator with PAS, ATPase and Fis domain
LRYAAQVTDPTPPYDDQSTEDSAHAPATVSVQRISLEISEGPVAGRTFESESDRCAIGSHPSNELVVEDPTVSRFHCELLIEPGRVRVRDLQSRNGTFLDGVQIVESFARDRSTLRFGDTVVRLHLGVERNELPLSAEARFGGLVGRSNAMRSAFALLERVASTEATVLIEGESGTGKEVAAEAVHNRSSRRDRPFVIIDCAAIPADLIESELFGHERGAFTGANERRIGAFEEAAGGTVFLDEIGELPVELQPKLLRVIERREVRRVGGSVGIPVDFRIIAATNRDLRAETNAGRMRADLYYRLAVVRITLPPLRARPEDVPLLVEHLLTLLQASPTDLLNLRTPEFLEHLTRAPWPGNVRELRNHLERCMVYSAPLPPQTPPRTDALQSFSDARQQSLRDFERGYLEELLRRHGGKATAAARAAGLDRAYLYRLLRRNGLLR